MIGGSNVAGDMQTYTYFLVRNQGEYFIANREGNARPMTVVNWTANPAIVKQGADGRQTNTLGIQVQGDNVIFTVNGTEMTRLPKSKIHADGLYGFRIGHNLDVDLDQVKRAINEAEVFSFNASSCLICAGDNFSRSESTSNSVSFTTLAGQVEPCNSDQGIAILSPSVRKVIACPSEIDTSRHLARRTI